MDNKEIEIQLHYIAGLMEQNGKDLKEIYKELRQIADKFSEIIAK